LIKAVALDKTGTLTKGRLEVQRIVPVNGSSERDVLSVAAALESNSDHPVAHAILERARREGIRESLAHDFQSLPGRGVKARIEGHTCWAGSHRMLHEVNADECTFHDTAVALEDAGHSVVALGSENEPVGFIGLADALRETARESVRAMKR